MKIFNFFGFIAALGFSQLSYSTETQQKSCRELLLGTSDFEPLFTNADISLGHIKDKMIRIENAMGHGVFKMTLEGRDFLIFGAEGDNSNNDTLHEVLSYKISELLKFHIVPKTEIVKLGFYPIGVQEAIRLPVTTAYNNEISDSKLEFDGDIPKVVLLSAIIADLSHGYKKNYIASYSADSPEMTVYSFSHEYAFSQISLTHWFGLIAEDYYGDYQLSDGRKTFPQTYDAFKLYLKKHKTMLKPLLKKDIVDDILETARVLGMSDSSVQGLQGRIQTIQSLLEE